MAKFFVFPDMQGVKEALNRYSSFENYPWIVYGETHRKIHLGFNGEDVAFSVEWYNTGYDASFASSDSLVRIQVSLAQHRNPVPRTKGTWSKKYPKWIPSKHVDRYFAWDKVPAELPKVMLTMFDKTQKGKLQEAYAEVARAFPSSVEHYEIHRDIDFGESRSRLVEEEEVNDARWREILHWVEEEWEGGGWPLERGDAFIIYALAGAMSLRFETYKHKPEDPRMLYSIRLNTPDSRGVASGHSIIFSQGISVPETLEDFLALYFKKNYAATSTAAAMRTYRRRAKEIQAAQGYQSLAEVYEYVMGRLRAPVEHFELHTDTSEFEENLSLRIDTDLTAL